jgi:hypothetical protein
MTKEELIRELSSLPDGIEVTVDVTNLGFIDILGVDYDPENPAASLIIDDEGPMQDVVRRINSQSL